MSRCIVHAGVMCDINVFVLLVTHMLKRLSQLCVMPSMGFFVRHVSMQRERRLFYDPMSLAQPSVGIVLRYGVKPGLRVLPRHVFMPFQTALAVSRSLQALGLARTYGPVRGSSWGGAEAGERLPVRCLRRAGHSPRVTSRPLGGRHVVRAADIISRSTNLRKGQDDSHMCRPTPCFTAHATPPWLACADVAQWLIPAGSLASVLVPSPGSPSGSGSANASG